MQQIDSQLMTALETDYQIGGTAVLIAEWNYNRTIKTTVTNTIDDANFIPWVYSKEHFPVSSITEGFRPDAGMEFAFTGTALPIDNSQLAPGGKRYNIVSKTCPYKYWISPSKSSTATGNNNLPTAINEFAISNADLTVEYNSYVKSNKIKITFANLVLPAVWRVSVFDQAVNNWVLIATSPTVDPLTGRAELWWNGTTWVQTQQLDDTKYKTINKIKVEFDSLNTPDQRLHVIEVAAMREIDMSARLQSYSISSTMDDVDFIHPVGQMNSNDGNIIIDNRDLEIALMDETSDYYGLIDGWCEFRTYVKFDMSKYSAGPELVRTSTMFSNGWSQDSPYEYSIELFDIMKLLQTIKCPAMLIENKSIARILSGILDTVGVDKYEFDFEDFDTTAIIRYFWTDGQESVYEAFNRICESHQCAVFVDEFGRLQLLTRNQIANDTDSEDFILRGQDLMDGPTKLISNFSSLRKRYELAVNDIEIKYKRHEANVDDLDITGKVLTSKVWDTSDTIVLKGTPLKLKITKDAVPGEVVSGKIPADAFMNDKDVETWPYKGSFSLDGEIFKYDGKGYAVIDYATNTWSEEIIKSNDDKKKFDKQTYNSYTPVNGPPGGSSGVPINSPTPEGLYQNRFTGRLRVTERGLDGTQQADHSVDWIDGWIPMNAWRFAGSGIGYLDYGGPSLTPNQAADFRLKPGWGRAQSRWRTEGSKVICDHSDENGFSDKNAILIRDLGDVEFREFGTRMKFTTGGTAGIIFCITDQNGYGDNDPSIEDPTDAHRFYMLSVITTEDVEAAGRGNNEININVKNDDSFIALQPMNTSIADGGGRMQINRDTWYDIELVMHDNVLPDGQGKCAIEVFVDGQYIDTYMTEDVIRPTNLAGLCARYSTVVEFEYFYASTSSLRAAPRYRNEDQFAMNMVTLPAGSNQTKLINFGPDGLWPGRVAMSATSRLDTSIDSIKILNDGFNTVPQAELGPVVLKADVRKTWLMEEIARGKRASMAKIKYSSTDDISLCFEYTKIGALPYYGFQNLTPIDYSYYSNNRDSFGYFTWFTSRFRNMVAGIPHPYDNPGDITHIRTSHNTFVDDFGSIIREVRDFDVELTAAPAKGTDVFVSNSNVLLTKNEYNPQRGIFTLVNTSHSDQIVNGSEEIDSSNAIDHTLMVYGYIIIEKEEKTKEVKNEESIRKHGSRPGDFDAYWINSDEEAQALADWISEHWSEPMATLEVKTFGDIYVQIGDKASVVYADSQIKPEWLYIVTSINRDFDESGLSTAMTLRRVR